MDKTSLTQFSADDIQSLSAGMKIGILGTVTPEGLPHLTMISTLKASSPHADDLRPVHRGAQQGISAPSTPRLAG